MSMSSPRHIHLVEVLLHVASLYEVVISHTWRNLLMILHMFIIRRLLHACGETLV
jgi:hypothetical protein